MIQIQRFNKALKSAVIIGDLAILNILFVSLYFIWTTHSEQKVFDGTLPQILVQFVLFRLHHFERHHPAPSRRTCRPGCATQPAQYVLFHIAVHDYFHAGRFRSILPFLFYPFLSVVHPLSHLLPADFPFLRQNIQKTRRQLTHGSLYGKYRKYDGTLS